MSDQIPDRSRRRKIDEQKEIFDIATREWLDERFQQFGRWTFRGLMAVIFIMLLRGLFTLHASDLRTLLEQTYNISEKLGN